MLVRDRGSWAGFLQDGSTADPPSLPFGGIAASLPPPLGHRIRPHINFGGAAIPQPFPHGKM